jgi:hypothetical protein
LPLGVAPGLNQDAGHNAILIDGTPEMMLHDLGDDKDFLQPVMIQTHRIPPQQTRCAT